MAATQLSNEPEEGNQVAFRWRESYLFPLFDECCRSVRLPFLVTCIMPAVIVIQTLGSSLWVGSKVVWGGEAPFYLRVIFYFCDLGLHNRTFSECWPQMTAVYAVVALSFIFLWVIFTDYRSKKSFSRWQMYLVVIIVVNLMPLLVTPVTAAVGRAVVAVNARESSAIVILCVLILVSFLVNALVVFSFQLFFNSPYLQTSLTAMFDANVWVTMLLKMQYMSVTSIWMDLLPRWMLVFLIAVALLIGAWEVYSLFFMPMVIPAMNGVVHGLTIYCALNCVSSIVKMHTDYDPDYYVWIPVVLGVVAVLASELWIRMRRKKIIQLLTFDADGQTEMSNREKLDHFDSMVFSSKWAVIMYIRVGLSAGCPLLVDCSFLRYLVENYGEKEVLLGCMRMVALLPAEQQLLTFCLLESRRISYLTIDEEFQLYQLRKINAARQSGLTYVGDDEFAAIQKRSEETISKIRGFWVEIMRSKGEISVSALSSLRKETMSVDSLFFDAIEQCPVSQALNEMYVHFMIEAEANYTGAVRYAKKIQMISQGKQIVTDYAFRSLVMAYPHYLYDRILDTRGFPIVGGEMLVETTSESSIGDSSSSAGDVGFDMHYDEIVQNLISQGKLRVAVQNCLRGLKFPPLTSTILLSLLLLLMSIVFACVILVVIPPIAADSMTAVTSNVNLAKISSHIQYISIICGVQLAIEQGKFGGIADVERVLDISENDLPAPPSILCDPYVAIHNSAIKIVQFLEKESIAIMDHIWQGWVEAPLMFDHTHQIQYVNSSGLIGEGAITTCMRSTVVWFSQNAEITASMGVASGNDRRQTFIAASAVVDQFSEINIQLSAQELGKGGKEATVTSVSIGVTIALFVFYSVLLAANYHDITKEAKTISRVLRSVRPDAVDQSFKRICLKSRKDMVFMTSVQSASEVSLALILYPIVMVVTSIAIAIVLLEAALVYANQIDNVRTLVVLTRRAAYRLLVTMNKLMSLFEQLDGLEHATPVDTLDWDEAIEFDSILNREGLGLSDDLDDLYLNEGCPQEDNLTGFSDYIKCSSFMGQVTLLMHYCSTLSSELPEIGNDIFGSPVFMAMIYLLDKSIFQGLQDYADKMEEVSTISYDDANRLSTILCVVAIVIALLSHGVAELFCASMKMSFQAFKQLLLLLPPSYVAREPAILEYVIGETNHYAKSATEAMLEASIYAALNVDGNLVIQTVSQGLLTLTGFTPDQTLGQPLSWLIPEEGPAQMQFYQKIKEITAERSESMITITISCFTERGDVINVHASLVARFDEANEVVQFSILLRDLTKEIDHKHALKEVKKRTDEVIQNLVPMDLASKLGVCDMPIFLVRHAVMIYVELVGIADYVHTTSAADLMHIIESIFQAFDEIAEQHRTIHVTGRWNGVYSAVCGLFGDSNDRAEQAEQSVEFCLDILRSMDDINVKLSTDIHLRFGVNAGGPVVGAFTNMQCPSFEVACSAKLHARNMQEWGAPDRVQVSKCVRDLLNPSNYNFAMGEEYPNADGAMEEVYYVLPIRGPGYELNENSVPADGHVVSAP